MEGLEKIKVVEEEEVLDKVSAGALTPSALRSEIVGNTHDISTLRKDYMRVVGNLYSIFDCLLKNNIRDDCIVGLEDDVAPFIYSSAYDESASIRLSDAMFFNMDKDFLIEFKAKQKLYIADLKERIKLLNEVSVSLVKRIFELEKSDVLKNLRNGIKKYLNIVVLLVSLV